MQTTTITLFFGALHLVAAAADYTCGCASCTRVALNQMAKDHTGDYSCGNRISWLMSDHGLQESEACQQVANDFPSICGPACDPLRCNNNQNETGSATPTVLLQPSPTSPAPVTPAPTVVLSTPMPVVHPCGCNTCTADVLQRMATDLNGSFSCQSRIEWLIKSETVVSEHAACIVVANIEFPSECGGCDPLTCNQPTPSYAPVTQAPVVSPSPVSEESPAPVMTSAAPQATLAPVTAAPLAPTRTFCGCSLCTQDVLNTVASDDDGDFTCGTRMDWFRNELGFTESQACVEVAAVQFHFECGACNPIQCNPVYVEDPDPSTLVWSDEFDVDGSPDSTKWTYDIGGGGWGNGEFQYYTDRTDNAFVKDGILNIRAVREDFDQNSFTSARMVSRNLGDWKYGRFRARARLQNCTAVGTWPAIWMLPTQWAYGGWPSSGEIDILEHVGYDLGNIHGSVHTAAFNHLIGTQKGGTWTTAVEDWHVYEIIWSEEKIQFVFDGLKYFEFLKLADATYEEWPFDKDFHLILNIAVGGSWGGLKGVDYGAFEGNGQVMEIDWVRVYQD